MTDVRRPLPVRTPLTAPFWDSADKEELALPWCKRCDQTHFPPSPRCPHCLEDEMQWRPASGKATLISWVVFHRSYWDGVENDLPYNVCLVELEEGPRMLSNLVGEAAEKPAYRMPLRVSFTKRYPDLILPVFEAL